MTAGTIVRALQQALQHCSMRAYRIGQLTKSPFHNSFSTQDFFSGYCSLIVVVIFNSGSQAH